jgi:hypothetical protein
MLKLESEIVNAAHLGLLAVDGVLEVLHQVLSAS